MVVHRKLKPGTGKLGNRSIVAGSGTTNADRKLSELDLVKVEESSKSPAVSGVAPETPPNVNAEAQSPEHKGAGERVNDHPERHRRTERHEEGDDDADKPLVNWYDSGNTSLNARRVGQALLTALPNSIFRRERSPAILTVVDWNTNPVQMSTIHDADLLQALLHDRLRFNVVKERSVTAKLSRSCVKELLYAPAFQQQIPVIDLISRQPVYGDGFNLCTPGYNDGGPGKRVLYLGPKFEPSDSTTTISMLLDAMDFETVADKTNALAAALTVLTRLVFSPKTPLILVTATKSHAGKGTVLQFACGGEQPKTLTLQNQDWATEKNLVELLTKHPELPMVSIDNVRLEGKTQQIASAFLEKFLTDDETVLYCTGSGSQEVVRRTVIMAMTTNCGEVIADLLNRALPIHLAPKGDVLDREHMLGNLGAEFIPQHRDEIVAELVGIVERWKTAGRPLNEDVKHSFSVWAKQVGGMVDLAEFPHFLGNFDRVRQRSDPVKVALGELGYATEGIPHNATELLTLAVKIGHGRLLVGSTNPSCNQSEVTRFGKLLTGRINECFHFEHDGDTTVMQLTFGTKRRSKSANGPERLYTFEQICKTT